jgi:hypothetical protein
LAVSEIQSESCVLCLETAVYFVRDHLMSSHASDGFGVVAIPVFLQALPWWHGCPLKVGTRIWRIG